MVARPARPCFHTAEVSPEFVVWSENPAGNWLHLQCLFANELSASGPGGLWLQADGCCSKASWVAVATSAAGNVALARGWQTFARARGLGRRCALHFRYGGESTLYVRVFGEDGRCARCCPKANDGEEVLGLGDGRDEDGGEPALGGGCVLSRYGGSSSSDSSSSSGHDQPRRPLWRWQWVISLPCLREA